MAAVKFFSGTVTRYLAEKIAHTYGKELGEVVIEKFSDGELSTYYAESVRGYDVFLIQSTFPSTDNLMELLLLIDAAKRASAKHVTAVVPYFGYARQDRKDKPRVAIGAKLIANLFSAAGADRLMTCDLHAGQIQGFFRLPGGSFQWQHHFRALPKVYSPGKPDLCLSRRRRGQAYPKLCAVLPYRHGNLR